MLGSLKPYYPMKTEVQTRYSSSTCGDVHDEQNEAIIISAFCGDEYYSSKASQLADNLASLGLEFEILEILFETHFSWVDACRAKSKIYNQMLLKHNRPIFWVDIDTQFVKKPACLVPGAADFGAFLRNFKHFQDFDPYVFGRIFHPGYLLFNNTPGGKNLANLLAQKAEQVDNNVTDDYVLHEVLKQLKPRVNILVFDPALICADLDPLSPPALIHGDSGNVKKFKNKVTQHLPKSLPSVPLAKFIYDKSQKILKHKGRSECIKFLNEFADLVPLHPPSHALLLLCLYKNNDMTLLFKKFSVGLKSSSLLEVSVDFAMKYVSVKDGLRSRLLNQVLTSSKLHQNLALYNKVRSLLYATELDEKAVRLNLAPSDRPHLWWWNKPYPGNLGDILNPYLIEKISGLPPIFAAKGSRCFAIGSILPHVKDDDIVVWGSGSPRASHMINSKATFLAVRGPLSRQVVLDNGGKCPEIYGDPALLLPKYYTPRSISNKSGSIGLILHHYHKSNALPFSMVNINLISVLRIGNKEIEAFIDEIFACTFVLSTSLHGIIIAHAYGVPAVWCTLRGQDKDVPGDNTKFHDYFLSVGLSSPDPVELSTIDSVDDSLLSKATLPAALPDLDKLLGACPFNQLSALTNDLTSVSSQLSRRRKILRKLQIIFKR